MEQGITMIIIIATLVILLFVVVVIVIFSIFQKKKVTLLYKQKVAKQHFDEEIIRSQLETQEQTLQNISWELHDNVGQLLSVARMQLNILQPNLPEEQKKMVDETGEIISKSLEEIRSLSKLLNPEVIKNIGLEEALQLEIDRFNRLNFINATFTIKGESVLINEKDEIILFRILQEFLSNSVKHSKTAKLDVSLSYHANHLTIKAQDFGIGFNKETIQKNSGLINMKSRANLIHANFSLKAEKDKGVLLTLTYPLTQKDA